MYDQCHEATDIIFKLIFARENEANQIHCLEHTVVITLSLAFRMFLC